MHASFAFQQETYVSAASVPERSASARSSARCGSNVPQMNLHRRSPGPVPLQALDARSHDLRVTGEPEVVVRREHDHLAASFHAHDRPLGRLEGQEALVRACVAKRVQLRAELLVEGRGHGVAPFGRRTILQASPDSSSANASS